MNNKDVIDTIECREKIVKFINYLEQEETALDDKFLMHAIKEIFTEASVKAYKVAMEKSEEKLRKDMLGNKYDVDDAKKIFDDAKTKFFKHCLMLEIKHNYTRADSIKLNPDFFKASIHFA